MELKELKQKIQSLINQNDQDYKEIKDRYTFLYKKKEETKELQAINLLKKSKGGNKWLKAFFMYKSIARANYQIEHLKLTGYEADEQGQNRLLEAINSDIELFIKNSEAKKQLTTEQPTNEQLLKMLGERIVTGEIKIRWSGVGEVADSLFIEDETGKETMALYLDTGEIEQCDDCNDKEKKHA